MEHIGSPKLPRALVRYFFCSPALDFKFRCLPSGRTLSDMRYRDFVEFNIIEARLRNIEARKGDRRGR